MTHTEPICFACKALERVDERDPSRRYTLALRCVCGAVQPAQLAQMRAEMWAEPEPNEQTP